MAKRDNKTVVFQKIPLRDLIETLQSVYNQGADYIDISGTPNEEQDVIGIHVLEEYLMNEDEEEEDGNDELSEDDLSKLL
jgi:3-dehydroquinate dehydratase